MCQGDTQLGLYVITMVVDKKFTKLNHQQNAHIVQNQEPGCCLQNDINGEPNCFQSGPDIPAFKSCPKTVMEIITTTTTTTTPPTTYTTDPDGPSDPCASFCKGKTAAFFAKECCATTDICL